MQTEPELLTPTPLAADATVLFIDIQHGIADIPQTIDGKHLRRGVETLARLAALFELPVLPIGVAPPGSPEPKIFHEIEASAGKRPTLVRVGPNSFDDRSIRSAIEATGRKTLVISGVFTEVAVQLPALAAVTAGYGVHVVVDACGGATERTEEAAFRRMTQAGVKMTSLIALAAELAATFASPKGEKALAILTETAAKK